MRYREGYSGFSGRRHSNRRTRTWAIWIVLVLSSGALLGWALLQTKRSLTVHFDLLITNGMVIDGTGAPAVSRTIGVRDGKIALVKWPYFAEAEKVIDASGLMVAPGFIDAHTHIEGNVSGGAKGGPLMAPNFASQGITMILTGNCGRSAESLSSFFGQLQSRGTQINIGSLVGHNTIRRQVMGEVSRHPTDDELKRMGQLVERGMQDGALGLSTGLEYTPGVFAEQSEIKCLVSVAARYGGVYATHMRDEGNDCIRSLSEALATARDAQIPIEISHLKWRGRVNWGNSQKLLDLIAEAQRDGVRVRCDAYPYTASSTTLDVLIPKAAREGGLAKLRERLKDPKERNIIAGRVLSQSKGEGWQDFSFARVASCDFAREYNGLTIPEITDLRRKGFYPTERLGVAVSAQSEAETVCDLAFKGPVQMIYENMSDEDVANILRFPDCMIGSDSGIRNGEGRPHPRGYGSAPRLLGRFALERGLFSLEEAVRKMTSLPAETFGLDGRGLLSPGYWADIVVFDPQTIRDRATYEEPFQPPDGIVCVLVNGRIVLDHGRTVFGSPGHVIRKRSKGE
jgi:N-acyl-D-amino-acid deacylase